MLLKQDRKISASQAGSYKRCPQAWAYRYIHGLKIAPAWAIKGRAQHKGLEHNYAQKIETHEDAPLADVLDAFRTDVEKSFTGGEEEVVLFPNDSKARIVDEGVAGLTTFQKSIAPKVQPIMVEQWVEMTLPWGPTLLGVIDCVDDTLTIRDAKFPADAMKPEEMVYEAQPPLYTLAYHAKTGEWPAGVVFDVVSLGRGKTPNPRPESIPIPVTRERIDAELRDLQAVEESIRAGVVYRRPSAMNCNRCGYRKLCWGNGAISASPTAGE